MCADEIWANKTKLGDLSKDCQSNILQKIKLHDLINIAKMKNNYLMLATDIFNKKFTNKVVKIGQFPHNNRSMYFLSIDDEVFQDVEFNTVFFVLEHFGENISSLIVLFGNDPDGYLKKSINFASQHCKNLYELSIAYGKDVLSDVTYPFHNVTKVSFYLSEFKSHIPNLQEMFRNMQQLDLNMITIQDANDCLDHNFPKLNNLSISFSIFNDDNDVEESKFKIIMEKNPQIRWLSINITPTKFVKFASEHLPNLETIIVPVITTVDFKGEIYFKSVKKFQLGVVDERRFENITFERLEEFHCRPDSFPIVYRKKSRFEEDNTT